MAVTSIWPIKGRVDKVINYARNPEKTHDKKSLLKLHEIEGVIEYAADENGMSCHTATENITSSPASCWMPIVITTAPLAERSAARRSMPTIMNTATSVHG